MGNTQSEENSDNSHDKDKNNNNGDEEEYEKMCNEYDRKTSSRQIYAKEAMKLHEEGKLVIIDTREVYEHEYAAIPNAKILSPTTLGMTLVSTVGTGMRYQQNIPLEELKKIPEDVTIVCSCTAGLRSGYCAVDLSKRLQRPVLNLHGGIISWFNAGGKVVNPKTNEQVDTVHTYGENWAKYVKGGKGIFKL